MALDVSCPNCGATLRAPEGAGGKKVRCKKCDHRFVLPSDSDVPMAEPVEDTQALSVIEAPAQLFGAPVAAAPLAPAAPLATPIEPEPVADPGNPFAFAESPAISPTLNKRRPPVQEEEPLDDVPVMPSPRRRSGRGSGSKLPLMLAVLGVGLLLGLGGAGVAVYFLFLKPGKPLAQSPTTGPERTAVAVVRDPSRGKETTPPTAKEKESAGTDRTPAPTGKGPPAKGPMTRGRPTEGLAAPPAISFMLPEPPKEASQLVARGKDRMTLENPVEAIKSIRFAYGNPPVAAVLWNSFAGFQGTGAKDTVDIYSIATGRRSERLEFPADGFTGPRLFEISPDGNRIVIEQPAGKLTVHDFDAEDKPLDGVDPFAGAEGLMGPPSAVRFITPDKLAVFDRGGALTVWDLKSKNRLVAGPPRGRTGPKDPPAVVATVNGDRILVATDGEVAALGIGTGSPVGPVLRLPDGWVPVALASDAAGKSAALIYRDAKGSTGLAILDIRDAQGGVTQHVALPAGAGGGVGVNFTGSDNVVVVQTDNRTGALIYEAESRVPTCYLRPAKGAATQFTDPISGRHWWVLPEPGDDKKATLTSAEMPFDDFFGVMNQAKAAGRPVYLVLRPEGLAK